MTKYNIESKTLKKKSLFFGGGGYPNQIRGSFFLEYFTCQIEYRLSNMIKGWNLQV